MMAEYDGKDAAQHLLYKKVFNSDKDHINKSVPYPITCEERKLPCGP